MSKLKSCQIQLKDAKRQSRSYLGIMGAFSSFTGLVLAFFNMGIFTSIGASIASIMLSATGQATTVTPLTIGNIMMFFIIIGSVVGGGVGIYFALRR